MESEKCEIKKKKKEKKKKSKWYCTGTIKQTKEGKHNNMVFGPKIDPQLGRKSVHFTEMQSLQASSKINKFSKFIATEITCPT